MIYDTQTEQYNKIRSMSSSLSILLFSTTYIKIYNNMLYECNRPWVRTMFHCQFDRLSFAVVVDPFKSHSFHDGDDDDND